MQSTDDEDKTDRTDSDLPRSTGTKVRTQEPTLRPRENHKRVGGASDPTPISLPPSFQRSLISPTRDGVVWTVRRRT